LAGSGDFPYSGAVAKPTKPPDYAALGRKGGKARLRTMTPEQRQEIAKAASRARQRKLTPEQRRTIALKAIRTRWAKARRRAQTRAKKP